MVRAQLRPDRRASGGGRSKHACSAPRGARFTAAQRAPQQGIQPEPLHPQDEPELEPEPLQPQLQPQLQPMEVPPTLTLQRLQPQEQDVLLFVVPPTLPVEPETASQSKQKQHFFVVVLDAPPVLPLLLQQGLQQDWPTNVGKVIPPKKPQELHIRTFPPKRNHTRPHGRV